jgi:hypothetical protein
MAIPGSAILSTVANKLITSILTAGDLAVRILCTLAES